MRDLADSTPRQAVVTGEAVEWALTVPAALVPTTRLVLTHLARHARPDGYTWPGRALLARLCQVAERTVTRSLGELVELKLIEACDPYEIEREGRPDRWSPLWRLHPVTTDPEVRATGGHQCHPVRASEYRHPATGGHPCHPVALTSRNSQRTGGHQCPPVTVTGEKNALVRATGGHWCPQKNY